MSTVLAFVAEARVEVLASSTFFIVAATRNDVTGVSEGLACESAT